MAAINPKLPLKRTGFVSATGLLWDSGAAMDGYGCAVFSSKPAPTKIAVRLNATFVSKAGLSAIR